jgi:NDP-sugar pyrophosphorylase family protein
LSTLERYLDISLALLHRQGSEVYSGSNSSIDPNAEVHDTVLWDHVIVEGGAYLRRAVLGDGVRIRSGETIEDAVVVRAELVSGKTAPAKALKGHVRGDNFVVSLSQ